MHIFQKAIIDQLRANHTLRYSELLPDDVESGHFKYHLDQLVKDKLVSPQGRGIYGLTDKGKAFVDRLSEDKINPYQMPKVITYTLLKNGDDIFLYKKTKEPYRGLLNFVGGKMHVGETPDQASHREVAEKTGIHAQDGVARGVVDIRIYADGALLTHAVAYVFILAIDTPSESLIRLKREQLQTRTDLAPDFLSILALIDSSDRLFVTSLSIDL